MRTRYLPVWFLAIALIGVGLWQGNCDAARAATVYVTNNLDTGAGTLRSAVDNSATGDTVAIVTPGPINITTPINITHSLTINGPAVAVDPSKDPISQLPANTGQVAIVSGGAGSVFNISGGNVAMNHLYISGGVAQGTTQTAGNGDDAAGGGIFNAGTLSLDYCTLANNNVVAGNGVTGGGNAYGGAIYSSGSVTINHSTIKNNTAKAGAGANAAGNANHAYGGGLYSTGSATILNSTFNGNTAQGGNSSSATGGVAEGGGVSAVSGSLKISNSTFNGNSAASGSGGTAGGNVYGGGVSATVSFNPLNSTFVGNNLTPSGGGTGFGSGIYYYSSATLVVNNCIIANNSGAANDLDATPGYNAFGSPGINTPVSINTLADNDGPTYTMSSGDTTHIVNVGDNNLASSLPLDQRGAPRVAQGTVDAGAMENNVAVPVNQAPTVNTANPFTFQLVNGTANFTAGQFQNAFNYPDPGDSLQSIVITGISGGHLLLNGQVVPVGSVISLNDLNNLTLVQTDPNVDPTFSFQPSDNTNPVPNVTVNAGEPAPFVPDDTQSPGYDGGVPDPIITSGRLPSSVYFNSAPAYTATAQSSVQQQRAPTPPATTPAENKTRFVSISVSDTYVNGGLRYTASSASNSTTTSDGSTAYTSALVPASSLSGIHTILIVARNTHGVASTKSFQYVVDQIPEIANKNQITSPQSINLGDTFSQFLQGTDGDYYIPGTTTTPEPLQFRVDQLCYGTGGTCDSGNTASNIGSFSDSNLTGNLPGGTTLDTTFNWKPTKAGKYNLKVTLTDYYGYPDTSFNFTVIVNPPANQPPVITNPGTQTAVKGTNFKLPISVTDAEGDPLTYTVSGLPPGLTFAPTGSGVSISGIPSTSGTYTVVLSVTDGNHTTPTTATFTIIVKDVGSPVIDNILVNGTALSSPVNVAANQNFNGLQATAHVNNYPDTLSFITYEGNPANTVGSWTVTNTTGSPSSNTTTSTASFSWPNVPPGVHVVTVRVTAQNGQYDEQTFTIQAGSAPTLSLNPTGPVSVNAGQQVSIAATAQESSANSTLTFSLDGAPTGVAFSGQSVFTNVAANTNVTANIQWTPTADQVGSYTFNVVVTDSAGLTATQPITINVDTAPANLPPTVQSPGPQTVNVGTNAHIQISATDPESQPLTYSATGLPGWASIDATTGLITGTPGAGDVGPASNVTVSVSDGVNTVTTMFTLTVVQGQTSNQPPVVQNPGTWTSSVGVYSTFSVSASDADNDNLTYTTSNLPSWVTLMPTFDGNNHSSGVILSGTPGSGDVGTTNATISVSDGINPPVTVPIVITVVASGVPTLQASPYAPANPEQVKLGDGYSKIFIATDTDYPETLTFSSVVTNMADNTIVTGATFQPMYVYGSATTGTTKAEAFQWTPAAAGTYQVVVSVTDAQGHVTSLTFSIHVDSPPSIDINPSTLSATPELPLSIPVNVKDGDPHETLSLSLGQNAPTGMAFSGSGLFVNVPANTTQTATLTWTPTDDDAYQTYTFDVIVTDSGGQTATKSVTINVGAVNGHPTINNPGTITLITGHTVSIPISASDPEGDSLTYHVSSSPSGLGLSIDSNGVIQGTVGSVGTYQETVTVDDGHHVSPASSMTFTVIVKAADQNSSPQWLRVPDQTVSVGQNVNIDLSSYVSDPDHDSVTISDPTNSLNGTGLSVDQTGLITGTPTTANIGTYNITLSVDDGYRGTTDQSFTLTVQPNQPPFSTTVDDYSLYVGDHLYVNVTTNDPEGNSITYTATGLPAWASINQTTGIISGTAALPYGSSSVIVTATDSGSGSSTSYPPFTITVVSPFSDGYSNVGDGYATITYTLLNNTTAAITPTVTGSLTGGGYTDNNNAFFSVSQGIESDLWASPILQRELDPTKNTRIITWTVGSLAPGDSATITITVPLNANTPTSQQLTNQWTAQYGSGSGSVTLNLDPVTTTTGSPPPASPPGPPYLPPIPAGH